MVFDMGDNEVSKLLAYGLVAQCRCSLPLTFDFVPDYVCFKDDFFPFIFFLFYVLVSFLFYFVLKILYNLVGLAVSIKTCEKNCQEFNKIQFSVNYFVLERNSKLNLPYGTTGLTNGKSRK